MTRSKLLRIREADKKDIGKRCYFSEDENLSHIQKIVELLEMYDVSILTSVHETFIKKYTDRECNNWEYAYILEEVNSLKEECAFQYYEYENGDWDDMTFYCCKNQIFIDENTGERFELKKVEE